MVMKPLKLWLNIILALSCLIWKRAVGTNPQCSLVLVVQLGGGVGFRKARMLNDIINGDSDLAGYLLAAALTLPAGWIAMKVLDWWDNRG